MIPRVLRPSNVENRPEALRLRALLVSLAWVLIPLGCAPPAPVADLPALPGPPVPSILSGETSRFEEREGVRLLAAAQDSLDSRAFEEALSLAEEVIWNLPRAPESGRALWIAARASEALERPGEAEDLIGRFLDLLEPTHPIFPPAVLLQARVRNAVGSSQSAFGSLLRLPPASPDSVVSAARELMRGLVPVLPRRVLDEALETLTPEFPLRGLLATEWAVALSLRGDEEQAIQWARRALMVPLEAREEGLAQSILEGRLDEALGRPVLLGVVIPRTGVSPGLSQYGEWFQEGVQVAVEVYRDSLSRPVQVQILDDRGTPLGARTAVRTLEGSGAMAALGFLGQDALADGASARNKETPILSPFSFLPPDVAGGVFSLSGPDLGEAIQLARIARELELQTVAIVRPRTMEAELNGAAFREEFQALGGIVPREIVFDSGGTFFQPQFREVEEILPDGMFLPLKPTDIQLFAPQITFYGMDTLGVQILGTSGWTDPAVVQDVDSRHTDGVVAATARLTQDETEAFRRFREAYEAQFQKTLRNEVPAFGYDAAALVLEGLTARPRDPAELVAALGEIRNLPGVTGILSIQGGRVTREPRLVRIQDHELIYITRRDH